MTVRVLIIDDSPTMRAILMTRLARETDIEVVGTAVDAVEGRELIKQLDPDVVTLDIEIPGMNGLDFLEKIMRLRPTPVIIVSGLTQEGTQATARALALGCSRLLRQGRARQRPAARRQWQARTARSPGGPGPLCPGPASRRANRKQTGNR